MDVREKLIKLIENGAPCPDGRDPFGDYCDTCKYSGSSDCVNERLADYLIAHGVTVQEWVSVNEPPKEYRDEYGELIPFLVCEEGTDYPFRALYDGKTWGDGIFEINVKWWMPIPQPPKGE